MRQTIIAIAPPDTRTFMLSSLNQSSKIVFLAIPHYTFEDINAQDGNVKALSFRSTTRKNKAESQWAEASNPLQICSSFGTFVVRFLSPWMPRFWEHSKLKHVYECAGREEPQGLPRCCHRQSHRQSGSRECGAVLTCLLWRQCNPIFNNLSFRQRQQTNVQSSSAQRWTSHHRALC